MTARKDTEQARRRRMPDADRFWLWVDKSGGPDACWLWTGGKSPSGYGKFYINRKTVRAHRASFYLMRGYWPAGIVMHTCDTPPCVNPAHLFEGTTTDNARDMISKGRGGGQFQPGHAATRGRKHSTASIERMRAAKKGTRPTDAALMAAHTATRGKKRDTNLFEAGQPGARKSAKYTQAFADQIRSEYTPCAPGGGKPGQRSESSVRGLAAKYGVSRWVIQDIVTNRRWVRESLEVES